MLCVLLLALGIAAFVGACKFRRKWVRIASRVIGTALLFGFLAWTAEMVPYLWALHLEARWQPADPKTKEQLESFLSLYSEREIQVSKSMWGRNHQLQTGERMVQYRLLYRAPLDVVYTRSNTIVAIYTSYE